VEDAKGFTIAFASWSKKISMSSSGLFKVTDSEEELDFKVYITAFNGEIWSSSADTGFLIDL